MAFRLQNKYTFYHIGRTGGTSVKQFMKKLGPTKEFGHHPGIMGVHCCPFDVDDHKPDYSFCIVRHPLTWLESNYKHIRGRKGFFKHWVNGRKKSKTFEEFINHVIDIRPRGYVTETYSLFMPYCKYILRTEKLNSEIDQLFTMWGFNDLPKMTAVHVSPKKKFDLSYKTKRRFYAAEAGIMKFLGYEEL